MSRDFRFVPDRPGIAAVSSGPGVALALTAAATGALRRMESLSSGMHRGTFFDFQGSLGVIAARPVRGEFVAYVGSNSPGWHLQEYGTLYRPPRAIIRRGIKATGIKFEEGR